MVEVRKTTIYENWFTRLRDKTASAKINVRIRRIQLGNFGDVKSVGENVSEIRIDHGPGYRVYFTTRGETVVLLLCGGDKKTQQNDIAKAKKMAK